MIAILALLLFVSTVARAEVYTHAETGFSMTVPDTWAVVEGDFYVSHYRHVFAAFNSIGHPTFQVRDLQKGLSCCGSIGTQLSPGVVYLDVGVWEGPVGTGPMPAYSWFPEQAVRSRIDEYLEWGRSTQGSEDNEGVVSYGLSFQKLGMDWEVRIYARKPFDQIELDQAFELLGSLHFQETPVTDSAQAVDLAIPYLPHRAKPKREWLECCRGMYHRYDVDVTGEAGGFLVRFTTLDGTNDRNPTGTYRFRVGSDGGVEVLGDE